MVDVQGLRRRGLVAALGASLAFSCDSDTIDLLPPLADRSEVGAAGFTQTGGMAAQGSDSTTQGGSLAPGSAGGSSSASGSSSNTSGGTGGGSGGSRGSRSHHARGFGDFGDPNCRDGFGACEFCLTDAACPNGQHCSPLSRTCGQCADNSHCGRGQRCDRLSGRCAPACQSSAECADGGACDLIQGTCVECLDDSACERHGDAAARICSFRRCVACRADTDCTRPDRPICAAFHCVECLSDDDCAPRGAHCNRAFGRCD